MVIRKAVWAFALMMIGAGSASADFVFGDLRPYYLPPCGPHIPDPVNAAPWLGNRPLDVRPHAGCEVRVIRKKTPVVTKVRPVKTKPRKPAVKIVPQK